jgi:DNA replication protein DnaC
MVKSSGRLSNYTRRPPPEGYVVLVGGTGKTHLAIAIARSCIRLGRRHVYNMVDLVNHLETETTEGALPLMQSGRHRHERSHQK